MLVFIGQSLVPSFDKSKGFNPNLMTKAKPVKLIETPFEG